MYETIKRRSRQLWSCCALLDWPVLAVLILGFFYKDNAAVADLSTASYGTTTDIGYAFLHAIPHYLKETAIAMLPIIVIFFLFQFTLLHLDSRNLGKIMIGLLYTYIGLVLFLTGVNIGFFCSWRRLGAALSSGKVSGGSFLLHGNRLVYHIS